MNKLHPKLLSAIWTLAVLAFVTVMLTASYFLTAYIYQITGLHPPILVMQIVNSLLGLLLTGLTIGSVASMARSKGWVPELNVVTPIIEAMQKIAKGDFSVRLDDNVGGDRNVFGTLAKSVNTMALELNQIETMRQEFISNVSHEIQSPLTSIRGFARALQNDALSPADRLHYLNIIETESMRLSKLSDNLLALAALDAENRAFEPRPYRLDKQIRNLIVACEPQWAGKALEVDVACEEVMISADEDLLSQVWVNLIHNSIKFTPHGGRICVDVSRQGGAILFTIADTGIGIAREDQAHIFERFYKADTSRTRSNNGGSGLGLSIAHKIVELHGGAIAVESQPGQGATFRVSLLA